MAIEDIKVPKRLISNDIKTMELPDTSIPLKKSEKEPINFSQMGRLRPCFRQAFAERWDLSGGNGHDFRVASTIEIHANYPDITSEQIATFFQNTPDYDHPKSVKEVNYIVKKYAKPYKCEKLRDKCGKYINQVCAKCPMNIPKKKKKNGNKKEKMREVRTSQYFLPNGNIAEEIYDRERDAFLFAIWNPTEKSVEYEPCIQLSYQDRENIIIIPHHDNLLRPKNNTPPPISLPSKCEAYKDEATLIDEVQKFIHKYLDVSPLYEILAVFYVLFTWVHDCFNVLPYLRKIGGYGTGKTRFLQTIGYLCYKPIFAGGATSTSPIFRLIEKYGGTLVLDEADFKNSDMHSDIIKILNCGYMKGLPVLRSEKIGNDFEPKAYDVYGAKLLATRRKFKDLALESRCLTEKTTSANPRGDIPIILPNSFWDEAEKIRNNLLMFRLGH